MASPQFRSNSRRPAISFQACANCSSRDPQRFCNLSATALLALHAIGTAITLSAHQVLLNEGFVADHIFLICSGRVKLVASSSEGRMLLLRVAVPGEIIGLAALLEGSTHGMTAITLGPCSFKSIPRSDFIRFMQTFDEVSRGATIALSREYNSAFLSARRLALSGNAAGKLANALLDWARTDKLQNLPGHMNLPISFPMPLTHEELGSMAGISRETVTRLLTKFRREGLIEQVDEQMVLHHPDQLESLYC